MWCDIASLLIWSGHKLSWFSTWLFITLLGVQDDGMGRPEIIGGPPMLQSSDLYKFGLQSNKTALQIWHLSSLSSIMSRCLGFQLEIMLGKKTVNEE